MSSELRQDLVSGDWIIVAPARQNRPHQPKFKVLKRKRAPVKGCPFENPAESGNKTIISYPDAKKWDIQVVENKYPIVVHKNVCGVTSKHGPYTKLPGIGHHDVVITSDHNKNFSHLSPEKANLVFQTFRDRYRMFYDDKCVDYVAIIQNWGPLAGASIYHPHYQIMAIPMVPPDVNHSLVGSQRYFKENKKCVHCVMIEFEQQWGKRIIFENENAIAFAPYVSRSPFEVRIFPKKHLPYFENTNDKEMAAVVEVLQKTLGSLKKNLNDPDYNFFIHTAPMKKREKYGHYHWHIEIIPHFAIRAGFELGTGLEINTVDPDAAALILRK